MSKAADGTGQTRWTRRDTLNGVWLALALTVTSVYLLPVTVPGERIILLVLLAFLWALTAILMRSSRAARTIVLATALVQLCPIRSGATRLLLLTGLGCVWLSALLLVRKSRRFAIPIVAAPAALLLFAILPGRPADSEALRREYVRSLTPYRGAVYIWGGENRLGIDCSGIVRCGWIDANLRLGLRTANPALIRRAISVWWRDCSAQELGAGYRGATVPIQPNCTLDHLDYDRLRAGAIAVTQDGRHTLAYLGNRTWIEAEPSVGGVAMLPVSSPNVWFSTPMRLVRSAALP